MITMLKTKSVVGMALLLFCIAGCAAIIHGTKQEVAVSSTPSGAKVVVMGAHMATTPGIIKLDRKDSNIVLRFEKDGYEPVEVALRRSVDGWIAGNILFGGLIGLVIDFASGAAYKLSPPEVQAALQEGGISLDALHGDDDLVVWVDMRSIEK